MICGNRTPESMLWSAVLGLAIEDLRHPDPLIRGSALHFFQSFMLDAVIAMTSIEQDLIPQLRQQAVTLYTQQPRTQASIALVRQIMRNDSDNADGDE